MPRDLSPEERYDLGYQLGQTIMSLFQAIAVLDELTLQETVQIWVEKYVATRIMEATGEEDVATE